MQKCSSCKENKPLSQFYKSTQTKSGLTYHCRECVIKRNALYVKNNFEKAKEYKKLWAQNNPDKVKASRKRYGETHYSELVRKDLEYRKRNPEKWREYYRERAKKYRINNPTKLSEYRKKRYSNNKLAENISHLMYISLKRKKNSKHWENLIEYKIRDLVLYLESKFRNGMSWSNYGEWHVDHIIPINLWKFNSYSDREFKQCWALCNLRPLWAFDNISKGGRI